MHSKEQGKFDCPGLNQRAAGHRGKDHSLSLLCQAEILAHHCHTCMLGMTSPVSAGPRPVELLYWLVFL